MIFSWPIYSVVVDMYKKEMHWVINDIQDPSLSFLY